MFTTMFLSMWISNTATTAMMLPIVDAVAEAINDEHAEKQQMAPLAEGEEEVEGVNIQLMICFACNLERANLLCLNFTSFQISGVKESKSQDSCHLSEEEDVFDAEGVQVGNRFDILFYFSKFIYIYW